MIAPASLSRHARQILVPFGMAWRASPAALCGQVAVAVLTGLGPVASAWLLRAILDDVVSRAGARIVPLVALLALASAVTGLLPNLASYLSAQSGRALQRATTAALFAAVGRFPGLRRLEDPAFRDRLNIAEQAGSFGSGEAVSAGISTVQSALTLSGFLATLLVLNPAMAAIVALAAIPAIHLERRIAREHVALLTRVSHSQRRQFFYTNLLTSLEAAKEIRLFALGEFFGGRILRELGDVQRASRQADRRILASNLGLATIAAIIAAGGLAWAALAAAAGRLTIGDLSIFVAALGSVAVSLGAFINSAAATYQALLMFVAYQDVLREEPDLPLPANPRPAQPLRRGLEIEDVWFRYGPDQDWILRGVSCVIPSGQAVGLVGQNGSGKSTLVKLLCRLYDPDRGRILWDGVDLRDMDLAALRERISVVFQDYMTYELTAAENIAVGDLRLAAQQDSLAAAARRAGVDATLAALPFGYQTLLTRAYLDPDDRQDPHAGVLLSGGQWQRVALARALLRGGRDLMILDEPSSDLDAIAEHEIHASLAAERAARTTVLISHRLNTVRDADQIVVLSGGVVSERGAHDELMARGGTYARLFSIQARGYALEPAIAGRGNG